MASTLYPLKFTPILKEKVWGGNKIGKILNHNLEGMANCGESWEVSGLIGDESEISNGFLAGNNLNEILEVYLTDLVGEKNYEKYGLGFPLLIKFIDAHENLSVQVHPDDGVAMEKYGQNGKTEMWHVVQADEGAGLYVGFNRQVNEAVYLDAVENGTLEELLRFHPVAKGDTFMIPAGTVHAIGKGVLLAEIQQSSDITFRIFDWNRVDENGKSRELHYEEALESIDFAANNADFRVGYKSTPNKTVKLVRSPYFNTNLLEIDTTMVKSFADIDSFVIYICLEGHVHLVSDNFNEHVEAGDVFLVPAEIEEVKITCGVRSRLLEIFCS
ncbi:MAG: type I phosphomannose isomerase catalytic subunit [Bacteroidales bacterium]|nr:type I phosphomannose isomerase catalytic subunit [Bacteroidales bacterium]